MFNIFPKPDKDGPKYASFERRMCASMVDTLFLALIFTPVFHYGWNPAAPLQQKMTELNDMRQSGMPDADYQQAVLHYMVYGGGFHQFAQNSLYQFALFGIVILLFWILRRGTPGKLLFAMEVVDAKTLGQPKKWQYILRYFGYVLACLPAMFGFVWIMLDKKRQGWHDKLAGTVVIVVPGWWNRKKKTETTK